jgi:hypothetical protein
MEKDIYANIDPELVKVHKETRDFTKNQSKLVEDCFKLSNIPLYPDPEDFKTKNDYPDLVTAIKTTISRFFDGNFEMEDKDPLVPEKALTDLF